MSVVGPRPALPNEVATYNDYQRQRLLVKPGMTCYWQTRRNRDLADPNLFMCQTVDSEARPIWIPPKLKPSVRRYLAAKGITEEFLFPSGIGGFSKARSANVPIRL